MSDQGQVQGALCVKLLPTRDEHGPGPEPLIDLQKAPHEAAPMEPVQLLESEEYLYEINVNLSGEKFIKTDKPEILNPDTTKGDRGRLRTGNHTGCLPVRIFVGDLALGQVSFEVRSRKLDYLSHYRWMLENITGSFSEVVMERFAPTEQRFTIDQTQDPKTLYQRFAFLKSLVNGDAFDASMSQILARPHRIWVEEEEFRKPGQNIRPTSAVARQLAKPGPRIAWQESRLPLGISSLPVQLSVTRREETLDTPENRFIKFALSLWRSVLSDIAFALGRETPSLPVKRGLREIQEVKEQLDVFLSQELFREVGRLTHFPASSQVLQKKEGYRDLYRIYIQFEAAALLTWQGGDDVYGAGQRDVATLYEFWVFLQLAKLVSGLCQVPFNWEELLQISDDGLSIRLRRGDSRVLSGRLSRLGRGLRVELWFNRAFGTQSSAYTTWTRPMRPDCSLLISPDEECAADFERVWLHFDAKYRVESLEGMFGGKGADQDEEAKVFEEEEAADSKGRPKRTDLLKMHAYRDAIRRTAGAYVIYPGDMEEKLRQYHEILPGLGAFALLPSESGDAVGTAPLKQFIEDVLVHVASQITEHERWRYWTKEAFSGKYQVDGHVHAVPYLSRPPADTPVLLGYVKNTRHLQWIHEYHRYNLRADGRRGSVGLRSAELAVEFVLLYGSQLTGPELWKVSGEPEIMAKAKMYEMGYPEPRSELYYCLPLEQVIAADRLIPISLKKIKEIRDQIAPNVVPGKPVTITWFEIVKCTALSAPVGPNH
jgi:predicted component of viral defense system (DUF524 family)